MKLQEYNFFKEIQDTEYKNIAKNASLKKFKKGEILFYQGENCTEVFFLKSGRIKVFMQSETISQKEITLYELKTPEQCLVNTLSTIMKQETIASAKALEECEVWFVPREKIVWLIDNSKAYRDFKFELCGKRLHKLLEFIYSLQFSSLEQRILNWIYVQSKERIDITHETLAAFLGVSREAISKNLKSLEKLGYISLSRGYINVIL